MRTKNGNDQQIACLQLFMCIMVRARSVFAFTSTLSAAHLVISVLLSSLSALPPAVIKTSRFEPGPL